MIAAIIVIVVSEDGRSKSAKIEVETGRGLVQ